MQKGKFYICSAVLLVVSVFFIIKILSVGNGDISGGFFVVALSFGVTFGFYKGVHFLKWVGIVGFSLLALATLLAALDNEDYSFLILTAGYTYVVWQLISVSKKPEAIGNEGKIVSNTIPEENHSSLYPTLLNRIQALFIDGMLLLATMIIVMIFTQGSSNASTIRIISFFTLGLLYEPLLTAYSATVGQRLLGIRVRAAEDPSKKINILQSYLRTIAKSCLGWLSFVTIHSNPQRRAIHDFAGSSVMIKNQLN